MNKRMHQRGSHHAILAIAMVVGLVGVLGFVGYNSWKKQSAGAAGIKSLGAIRCIKAPCEQTPQAPPAATGPKFVFSLNQLTHFAFDVNSSKLTQLGAPYFVSGQNEIYDVSADRKTALVREPGKDTLVAVSLIDGKTVPYNLKTYGATNCPNRNDSYDPARLSIRDDLSVDYVERIYDCSKTSSTGLLKGVVKTLSTDGTVRQSYGSVSDVLEIHSTSQKGMLYRNMAGKYVSVDSSGGSRIQLSDDVDSSSEATLSGDGLKIFTRDRNDFNGEGIVYKTDVLNPNTPRKQVSSTNQCGDVLDVVRDGTYILCAQSYIKDGRWMQELWLNHDGTRARIKVADLGDMSRNNTALLPFAQFVGNNTIVYFTADSQKNVREVVKINYEFKAGSSSSLPSFNVSGKTVIHTTTLDMGQWLTVFSETARRRQ